MNTVPFSLLAPLAESVGIPVDDVRSVTIDTTTSTVTFTVAGSITIGETTHSGTVRIPFPLDYGA